MARGLSLALIVRDESLHLPECLQSVQPLLPEVCVVDTGSTDDTVTVAQSLGARVSHFAWNNSFADARNASLAMCTRAWILVMDADERLAPEDLGSVRELLRGPAGRAYRFITRNYTNAAGVGGFRPCLSTERGGRGYAGWFPSEKIRLFPNGCGIQFEGVIHELVTPSVQQQGLTVADCEIPIHHYPLMRPAEAVARKQALYLTLGMAKVRSQPANPQAHIELGNQYADVGDYPAAAAAYRAALQLQPESPETLKDLGGVLHVMGRNAEAQKALELAVRLQPALHEGWRNLGVVLGAGARWSDAADCFRRALDGCPTWHDGHRYLSVALENAGRLDEAAAAAQAALEQSPESREAAEHYAALMARSGRTAEALSRLDTLLIQCSTGSGWRHARRLLAQNAIASPRDS